MSEFNIRFIQPEGDGNYISYHDRICKIYDEDSLNKDEIQWIIGEEEIFEENLGALLRHGWVLMRYIYKFCDRFFAIDIPHHSDYGHDYDCAKIFEVVPYTCLISDWKVKEHHEYE